MSKRNQITNSNPIVDTQNNSLIIWNQKNEKGIQIEITQLPASYQNTIYVPPITAFRIKYYMVEHSNNSRGRLLGTCLPDVIYGQDDNLYHLMKECNRLVNWTHPDYFLVGPSTNPLKDSNAKFELYYWPVFTEYPSLALDVPAATKSNGDLTLYLDPKFCKIEYQYYPVDKMMLVTGYDDLICGLQSGLGSRRFQRQIFTLPERSQY